MLFSGSRALPGRPSLRRTIPLGGGGRWYRPGACPGGRSAAGAAEAGAGRPAWQGKGGRGPWGRGAGRRGGAPGSRRLAGEGGPATTATATTTAPVTATLGAQAGPRRLTSGHGGGEASPPGSGRGAALRCPWGGDLSPCAGGG